MSKVKFDVAELFRSRRLLASYLRDSDNNPYGVVVAVLKEDGNVAFGHSVCNTKLDQFDKKIGLNIAVGRALKERVVGYEGDSYALYLDYAYDEMYDRAQRYFKVVDEAVVA